VQALLDENPQSPPDNRLVEAELELSQRLKNAVRLVVSDHPLAAIPTEMKDSVFDDNNGVLVAADPPLTSGQLRREIDSVALDWRSLRNIRECVCSTPFDHFSKKVKTWFQYSTDISSNLIFH
jgi:hypothetical protein